MQGRGEGERRRKVQAADDGGDAGGRGAIGQRHCAAKHVDRRTQGGGGRSIRNVLQLGVGYGAGGKVGGHVLAATSGLHTDVLVTPREA